MPYLLCLLVWLCVWTNLVLNWIWPLEQRFYVGVVNNDFNQWCLFCEICTICFFLIYFETWLFKPFQNHFYLVGHKRACILTMNFCLLLVILKRALPSIHPPSHPFRTTLFDGRLYHLSIQQIILFLIAVSNP